MSGGYSEWMIYGANGYTGELIAREAKRRGLNPLLAGRGEAEIAALGRELGLQRRVFPLEKPGVVAGHLEDIALVLHCAGPFSATSAPMVEACLSSRTHYLDITGEIDVFEYVHNQSERAKDAGVALCPGVGFDVIPTDCVAASLKAALPDATHLALGFDSRSGLSPGTAKTSVEGMAKGCKVRRDGEIVSVPLAYKTRGIDFGDGEKLAMTIPWGDLSTAYYTTGIPNIEIYIPGSPRMIAMVKRMNLIRPLLSLGWVQGLMKSQIAKKVQGPDMAERGKFPAYVWGEVTNGVGEKRTARIKTANGYDLTVSGSLEIVARLLNDPPAGGGYTPSQLMGRDFVATLPDSGEMILGMS